MRLIFIMKKRKIAITDVHDGKQKKQRNKATKKKKKEKEKKLKGYF